MFVKYNISVFPIIKNTCTALQKMPRRKITKTQAWSQMKKAEKGTLEQLWALEHMFNSGFRYRTRFVWSQKKSNCAEIKIQDRQKNVPLYAAHSTGCSHGFKRGLYEFMNDKVISDYLCSPSISGTAFEYQLLGYPGRENAVTLSWPSDWPLCENRLLDEIGFLFDPAGIYINMLLPNIL